MLLNMQHNETQTSFSEVYSQKKRFKEIFEKNDTSKY